MQRTPMNVGENWTLQDTVIIIDAKDELKNGWFNTLAALGATNDVPFFNVRNRSVGLYWNDQDSRDTFPYAYELHSLGIRFWGPSMTQWVENASQDVKMDNASAHIFVNDLPRHAHCELQIQQDIRLKANIAMLPSGMGISGDGYGAGFAKVIGQPGDSSTHFDSINQGEPDLTKRWLWPLNIGIPRRANLSVKIVFNQYGKELLGVMNNGEITQLNTEGGESRVEAFFGMQVTLRGRRFVQQRGDLHV